MNLNLKKEIQDKGLKLKFVAKKININESTLRVYLSDTNRMTDKVEEKIVEFLGLNKRA